MENYEAQQLDVMSDLDSLNLKVDRVRTLFAKYRYGNFSSNAEKQNLRSEINAARQDVINFATQIQANVVDGKYGALSPTPDMYLYNQIIETCRKHIELMFDINNEIVMASWMEHAGLKTVPCAANSCEAMYLDD